MNSLEFIIGISTLFVTQIISFLKTRSENKQRQTDMDTKQTSDISIIKEQIAALTTIVQGFIKDTMFKHELKDALEIKADSILRSNPDLDTNILTLLHEGRDAAIKFSKFLYYTSVPISVESLNKEVSHVFDRLKMLCNYYFPQKRLVKKDIEITFARYLREHTNLNNESYAMIQKIIDVKSGKYNGQTENKFIHLFVDFLENSFIIGIQSWRKFQSLDAA